MDKMQTNLKFIQTQQSVFENKKYLGQITHFDEDLNQVWVDFDENLYGCPLVAKLGRPFQLEDLKRALDSVQYILIEFEANNMEKPVIMDIFYSVLDKKIDQPEEKELMIKGKKLTFKASEGIYLECGDTKITLECDRRGISMRGENVTSTAANRNRIRGGHVSLN